MSSIEHVDQLLALNGPSFIDATYLALLGREVDSVGKMHYLNKLMQGAGKAAVLRQLAESKECRARQVKLDGLDALISEQKRVRHWFWGTLSRSFRMEKQANRLEWQLGMFVNSVQKLQLETGDRFARLDGWMSQGGGSAEGTSVRTPATTRSTGGMANPWADTSSLSQPARQIFARLTQARAARETC